MPNIVFKHVRPAGLFICAFALVVLASVIYPSYARSEDIKKINELKQVGAFADWHNALAQSEAIIKSGKEAFILEKKVKGKTLYTVLEGKPRPVARASEPAPVKLEDMGYRQVGAFLDRHHAEDMIYDLRQKGEVTFHCMKKQDDKIYFKVYIQTSPEGKSPCSGVPAYLPPPMLKMPAPDMTASVAPAPAAPATVPAPAPVVPEAAPQAEKPSAMQPAPEEEITEEEVAEAETAEEAEEVTELTPVPDEGDAAQEEATQEETPAPVEDKGFDGKGFDDENAAITPSAPAPVAEDMAEPAGEELAEEDVAEKPAAEEMSEAAEPEDAEEVLPADEEAPAEEMAEDAAEYEEELTGDEAMAQEAIDEEVADEASDMAEQEADEVAAMEEEPVMDIDLDSASGAMVASAGTAMAAPVTDSTDIPAAQGNGDTTEISAASADTLGADENSTQMTGEPIQEAPAPKETASSAYKPRITEKAPLLEKPPYYTLDSSPIRDLDDGMSFYIKPGAIIFKDRNQYGIWYGKYNDIGGATVTGQSNKWFVIKMPGGQTGYVMKADTVDYNIPYSSDSY